MDDTYLQGFGLDDQLMEEGNLFTVTSPHGLFQHPAHISPFAPFSLSAPDPTLLQINENGWFNRVKISPAGNLGVDTSGHLPHQRPNIVMQSSQLNIPAGIMTAAISTDSFQSLGDIAPHAQWKQMCSLSSDEYSNDVMPQLISDYTIRQPFLYTSSSDCPHEADSGSFERGRQLSRSCLVGSPCDDINWRISDVLQGNLGSSTAGLPIDALPNDFSSVAAELDSLDPSLHALSSLGSMPGPAGDCIPFGPVSWMSPSTIELDTGSTITSLLNQRIPNLDSLGSSLSTQSNGAPHYKRHRASYKSENSSARPLSKPVIPLVSRSTSTNSSGPDCPMISLNITNALYNDFHVSKRQTLVFPEPTVIEAVGGSAVNKDQLNLKCHRKQNATSIEPQSVAARHRRRKISERVRVLEKLIPGGNKMDTASMLDESIEYVKFLQLQVQLLESLGDMSNGSTVKSTPSLPNDNIGRGEDGLDTKTNSFGSQAPAQASQSCKSMPMVRPAASPLILSEILQHQLFKQKLCLVSLRQCPPTTRSSTSGSYA